VTVNIAEIYHVNATEFAAQCGYQSNSAIASVLGISPLNNEDADEAVHFIKRAFFTAQGCHLPQ